MKTIAVIHNDLPEKFGVPRQSLLCPSLTSRIVFEEEYRNIDALRGLEAFSHIWLLWDFSLMHSDVWSPTVRPPRLGGNTRLGVFATRSPNRPNPIGLSSVRLEKVVPDSPEGPVLIVSGADLCDGTPIFDIKPYIPSCDSHPEASGGFTDAVPRRTLNVVMSPGNTARGLDEASLQALKEILAQDPRPAYQDDPSRIYGLAYAGGNIKFRVEGDTLYVQ